MKDKQAENNDNVEVIHEQDRTRGAVSFVAVITGVVVAIGAFVVLSAIVGGILAALGVAEGGISPNEVSTIGIGAGIGLVIAQFLAYFWGGYTSGRMARGSGVMNGILVPIVAIILVVILGAVAAAITSSATELRPSDVQQLPLPLGDLGDIGTVVGIALLVAMFVAGALGGARGQRWHTKLEKRDAA